VKYVNGMALVSSEVPARGQAHVSELGEEAVELVPVSHVGCCIGGVEGRTQADQQCATPAATTGSAQRAARGSCHQTAAHHERQVSRSQGKTRRRAEEFPHRHPGDHQTPGASRSACVNSGRSLEIGIGPHSLGTARIPMRVIAAPAAPPLHRRQTQPPDNRRIWHLEGMDPGAQARQVEIASPRTTREPSSANGAPPRPSNSSAS